MNRCTSLLPAILVIVVLTIFAVSGCGGGGFNFSPAVGFGSCETLAGCYVGGSGSAPAAATPEQFTGYTAPVSVETSPFTVSNVFVCDQTNVDIGNPQTGGVGATFGASGMGGTAFVNPVAAIEDTGSYQLGADGGNGVVYVLDAGASKVDIFTRADSLSTTPYTLSSSSFGTAGTGPGEFNTPKGMAQADSGELLIVDSGNHVVEGWGLTSDSGMTSLPFVNNVNIGASVLQSPQAVAVDLNDNVYVADSSAKVVYEFSGSGTLINTIGSPGTAAGQFSDPTGVAVDNSGNLYVADPDNHVVDEFTPNSSSGFDYSRKIGSKASSTFAYTSPISVTVDPSRDVYVLDSANKKVTEFPPGT